MLHIRDVLCLLLDLRNMVVHIIHCLSDCAIELFYLVPRVYSERFKAIDCLYAMLVGIVGKFLSSNSHIIERYYNSLIQYTGHNDIENNNYSNSEAKDS